MKMEQYISIRDYLSKKGINYREVGGELVTRCCFNHCDDDSRNGEAHLYFNPDTSQYSCHKCGVVGNIVTLAKHLGDEPRDVILTKNGIKTGKKRVKITDERVQQLHESLRPRIRQYLNQRGISDDVINRYKLGYGDFYGSFWITIPIKSMDGEYIFLKLRQDPDYGSEKITYPKGFEAQIYGWETLQKDQERICICEGELDRLNLVSKGIPAISSTHGANTFKKEWVKNFRKSSKIYICYDNDNSGRQGAERVASLFEAAEYEHTHIISLPEEVGERGDITDYFVKLDGNANDLFVKYAKKYPEPIDKSKLAPLSVSALAEILGLTIKQDDVNKVVTFLCELSSYTENSQINLSFNAPSSTGKSYIPTEIARLFPSQDVIEIGYCSPTAFFHDVGELDKESGYYRVDLSRKILIFLDQPHTDLIERLRPLLSHDKKEIVLKITDKNQKHGTRTKNILLIGYPSVIFCTAGLRIDEQEATRFILLSPEINQEKLRQAVCEVIVRESDNSQYRDWLAAAPGRRDLKNRIVAIKKENINDIRVGNPDMVKEIFLKKYGILKPRHQRDVKRFIDIIKSLALLNLWWRQKKGSTIIADEKDIQEALKLWEEIGNSQNYGLPPYIYNFYSDIILPLWSERGGSGEGITRQELLNYHYKVQGRIMDGQLLRQQILPMLEISGLIMQESDPNDRRRKLIYPTSKNTIY